MIKNIVVNNEDGTSQIFLPQVQPTPPPQPQASNLGMNLAAIDYYLTSIPFVNLNEVGSKWIGTKASWGDTAVPVNGEGNPTTFPTGVKIQRLIDFNKGFPNKVQITWSGDPTAISVAGAVVIPGGLEWTKTGTRLTITANKPFSNLWIVESNVSRIGIWRTAFIDRLYGFGYIRFMDWGKTNDSPQNPRVSVDKMVDLCPKVKARPWYCVHHLATDDQIRAVALALKGLDPIIEHSNEVWNTQFPQAQFARQQPNWMAWHINRTAAIGAIFDEVGCKHTLVLGEQCAGSGRFIAEINKGLKIPPSIKGIAIAPYFGHKVGDAGNKASIISGGVDWVLTQTELSIPTTLQWIKDWKTWTDSVGLKLLGYEGGQHVLLSSAIHNDPAAYTIFEQAQRHQRMADAQVKLIAEWNTLTGKAPLCLFNDVQPINKWGAWGNMEDETDINNPKFVGIKKLL